MLASSKFSAAALQHFVAAPRSRTKTSDAFKNMKNVLGFALTFDRVVRMCDTIKQSFTRSERYARRCITTDGLALPGMLFVRHTPWCRPTVHVLFRRARCSLFAVRFLTSQNEFKFEFGFCRMVSSKEMVGLMVRLMPAYRVFRFKGNVGSTILACYHLQYRYLPTFLTLVLIHFHSCLACYDYEIDRATKRVANSRPIPSASVTIRRSALCSLFSSLLGHLLA
jgi:hypothetical protein